MLAEFPLISLLIWLPILGGVWVLFQGRDGQDATAKPIALFISILTFALSLLLYTGFDLSTSTMQFAEKQAWIPAFNMFYHLGVDGISMPLIILTTFITVLVLLAGWDVIKKQSAQYMAAFLIMKA